MAFLHRVALVRHADGATRTRPRHFEGMPDDAMHALVGVDLFLNSDLVYGARLEAAADTNVETFSIFAKHDEVDVHRRAILQRTEPRIEQPNGSIVDVEIEIEARAEQDVARVPVVWHARIAKRADQDRIERAQQIVAAGRHGLARREEMIRAPRQVVEINAAERLQHLDSLSDHLRPDAVAGDYRDALRHWRN